MSKPKLQTIQQLVIPPRDEKDCEHDWSYHTYWYGAQIVSKKLCFYCKKVEDL